MPWSEKVLQQFQAVPVLPLLLQDQYHGPFNKLLHTLFPVDSDFTVSPQFLMPLAEESADFIVMFEILVQNRPVLVLQLKDLRDLQFISSRQTAHQQIRRHMGDIAEAGLCPIRTLYGIIAMGTRMCFYHVDARDPHPCIVPVALSRHPTRINNPAPEEWWDCDVLKADGEARLREVVDEIMEACTELVADD
ncbi:hypothetical protein V8B97DRAFT_943359 [Scleroderma yunnanense]